MSVLSGFGFRLKVVSFSSAALAAAVASIHFASNAHRNSRGDFQRYGNNDRMYASICAAVVRVAPVPIAPVISAGPRNPDR